MTKCVAVSSSGISSTAQHSLWQNCTAKLITAGAVIRLEINAVWPNFSLSSFSDEA